MLVALILELRVSLNIVYEDELHVFLRVLFIKIRLFPSKKKKFNAKKHEKKQKKKAGKPSHVIKERNADENKSTPLVDNIRLITEIISIFFKASSKYLRVKLAKIHIKVATGDAAQTAILYGAVSSALACLIELLDSISNLQKLKSSSIQLEPDYLSDKSEARINISLSLNGRGALIVLVKCLRRYINYKNNSNK